MAIVFGSIDEVERRRRTLFAVQLYHENFVPRILLSGGGATTAFDPEAETMAKIACQAAVPGTDLLIENKSKNTITNVTLSRKLLDEADMLKSMKTILLISSEWHMGRVLQTASRYFRHPVRFVCCPPKEGWNRNDWMNDTLGRRTVLHELEIYLRLREHKVI